MAARRLAVVADENEDPHQEEAADQRALLTRVQDLRLVVIFRRRGGGAAGVRPSQNRYCDLWHPPSQFGRPFSRK